VQRSHRHGLRQQRLLLNEGDLVKALAGLSGVQVEQVRHGKQQFMLHHNHGAKFTSLSCCLAVDVFCLLEAELKIWIAIVLPCVLMKPCGLTWHAALAAD
jgi:hypothetical protein